MGTLKLLTASILKWILYIPLLLIDIAWASYKWELDDYAGWLAVGEDVHGGFLGKYLFNFLFLKKTAKLKYGEPVVINGKNYYVTISRVTADNLSDKELKDLGKDFADILISAHDKAFTNL